MNSRVVIVPTFNEKENIIEIIEAVFALKPSFDVLVIDDNSPDGTAQLVKNRINISKTNDNNLYLIERPEKSGLGTAYIEGFNYALEQGYGYIFEMDADFSHNPEDLLKLYEACSKDDYDISIGSRYVRGVNVVNWPLNRVLLSLSAGLYVRWVTGLPIKDPTAGFVCYKREVLERIDLSKIQFTGYAFQIEMKYLSWKAGYKLKEVTVVFVDRVKGKSKMSISIFWEAFFGVIGMKFSNYHKKLNPETEKAQIITDSVPDFTSRPAN